MVPPGIPNTTLAPAASSDRTIDCAPVIDSPCPTPPRATSPGVTVAAWRCAVGSVAGRPATEPTAQRQAATVTPGDVARGGVGHGESITGAQSIVRSLEAAGAKVVFGIPGGTILPAYDPLMDSTKLRHILVRHEQGAGHAAEGYAYSSGQVGVCMATSGPGATNLVTALADANMDSVPVVAITGQVGASVIGTDAFQEADIVGITLPVTKHSFLVTDPDQISGVIAQAFHIARTAGPGPVLVDIAKSAMQLRTTFNWPAHVDLPGYHPVTKPHIKQIREAARLLATAHRPVLYVGGLPDLLDVRLGDRVVAGQIDVRRPVEGGPQLHRGLGDVHEHRARTAGPGDVERLGDDTGDLVRVGHQEAVLGDRQGDPDDVRLLEGVGPDHRCADLSGDRDDRDRVHVGVGQRRDQVRRAGAGGGHADADVTRGVCVALGRMAGTLLVPHQDVPQLGGVHQWDVVRPDGHYADPEHHLGARGLERPHDRLRAGDRLAVPDAAPCHVSRRDRCGLALRRRLAGRLTGRWRCRMRVLDHR